VPEEIVLQIKWGGLGDHLFWSHIPAVAKGMGVKRVLLNARNSDWRHNDYREMWRLNPHLDGETDKPCTKRHDSYPYSPAWNMIHLQRM